MRLQRVFSTADPATPRSGFALGVLRDDAGKVFWTTFENQPIPVGVYACKLLPHPVHGECWEVCGVPGRTGILFHVGNSAADSEGCILVGYGFFGRTITLSNAGYARFRQYLASLTSFTLTVLEPPA